MKKLLVMNHYPTIYPPNTGGVLRYFHLYHKLSRYYDVTLLSQKYTPEVEIIHYSNRFREYRIPTNAEQYRIDERLIREGTGPRFSTHAALSCALLKEPPADFRQYYDLHYADSDLIIHDTPFLFHYDVHFGTDNKPRIYNSHNHESEFAKHIWYGDRAKEYIALVTQLEESLVQRAAYVYATSEDDRQSMITSFNISRRRIKLAPNGVIPDEWERRRNDSIGRSKVTAFFIGSMHQPNIEIVAFVVSKLAKQCPEIEFIIAGQCSNECGDIAVSNVNCLGGIDDVQKKKWFAEVDVAINPAFYGTGTKIKTLEFMSAGIPLLSTEVGVKGLTLTEGTHYFLASHNSFAEVLNKIAQDKSRLRTVAANGQAYINRTYSWEAVAKQLKKQFDPLVSK